MTEQIPDQFKDKFKNWGDFTDQGCKVAHELVLEWIQHEHPSPDYCPICGISKHEDVEHAEDCSFGRLVELHALCVPQSQ